LAGFWRLGRKRHCDLLVGNGVGARFLRINGIFILHAGVGDAVMRFHLVDRTQRLRDSVTELEIRNHWRCRHVIRAQHKNAQRSLFPTMTRGGSIVVRTMGSGTVCCCADATDVKSASKKRCAAMRVIAAAPRAGSGLPPEWQISA
jgi:hypothetical protein